MIWTTTTQIIFIGMAAFCISFGLIYSLIFCFKSRRKSDSEENVRLRDELLRDKFIMRRKSTSLSSPPSSTESVINPNYNASPYKVPTRHLRSTSATYSPTHYLSPHHRRNSTPTQPNSCSKCNMITKSPSPSSLSSSSASAAGLLKSLAIVGHENEFIDHHPHHHYCNCCENDDCNCKTDPEFHQTHKFIPIPSPNSRVYQQQPQQKMQNLNAKFKYNQKKSFSFGPIPKEKALRRKGATLKSSEEDENAISEEEETMGILEDKNKKKEMEESSRKEKFIAEDVCDSEKDSLLKETCGKKLTRKNYTPDLFKKENVVMEEIPYYYTDNVSLFGN